VDFFVKFEFKRIIRILQVGIKYSSHHVMRDVIRELRLFGHFKNKLTCMINLIFTIANSPTQFYTSASESLLGSLAACWPSHQTT